MDQHQLLEKAKRNDLISFRSLVRYYEHQLKPFLYRLLTDRKSADECYNESMEHAFNDVDSFSGNVNEFKTWLFKIVTKSATKRLAGSEIWPLDAQDYNHGTLLSSAEYWSQNNRSPEQPFDIRDHIDFCFTCLNKSLVLDKQIIMLLKNIYWFSLEEISTITNKSVEQIELLLNNANRELAKQFDLRCGLINKKGNCKRCLELHQTFDADPKSLVSLNFDIDQELDTSEQKLLELRMRIVQSTNPLSGKEKTLHEHLMDRLKEINKVN